MPQGLQVWDDTGVLVRDTNTPSGVIAGVYSFPGGAAGTGGSVVIPALALGQPFHVLRGTWFRDPAITISGTTISWTFSTAVPALIIYEIIYGYF
jgi:hypothetical protein